MVLLDVCARIAPAMGATLHTIHIHHGLRPSADEDAAFCAQLAAHAHTRHHTVYLDIPDQTSVQRTARSMRWAAILDVCIRQRIPVALTGHHRDDALETALINLTRGTASAGLSSLSRPEAPLPFTSPGDPRRVVRPLLDTSRAAIEAYATTHELTWRQDPTNAQDTYQRNRLRHHVLPALLAEEGASAGVATTLKNLREEADALEAMAQALATRAAQRAEQLGARTFDQRVLMKAPRVVLARMLLQLPEKMNLSRAWARPHIHAMLDAIMAPVTGEHVYVDAPGALMWTCDGHVVFLPSTRRGARGVSERVAHPIAIDLREGDGEVPWFDGSLRWGVTAYPGARSPAEWMEAITRHFVVFDRASLTDRLTVRGAHPGESLWHPRDRGTSAREAMRAAAVSADRRWWWPCVADADDRLLWVCSVRRADALGHIDASTQTIAWFEHRQVTRK